MYRALVSVAVLSLAACALTGCPDDDNKAKSSDNSKKATKENSKAAKEKPSAEAAAPGKEKEKAGAEPKMGTATIKGVVSFTGKPVEMKSPAKRKDAEFCKDKDVKYNAVIVKDGKLQDVFVRLANGAVKGDWKATKKAEIDQKNCMYEPRIQGVVAGGEIEIKNSDGTLHNVHTFKGTETWFNQAQPKGSEPVKKELEDTKVIKFTCDVHPWMRGFVVVTDHPFFAVSGADGSFTIDKVPAGKYDVEAWHSQYGLKKGTVEVVDGKPAEVNFTYSDADKEPDENKDELKGLW
jgi:plastocyanin